MPRSHGNVDEAIASGSVITEYHQHETNPDHYTVHVRQANGEANVFTNITAEHLQSLLPKAGMRERALEKSWVSPKEEEHGGKKGGRPVFDDCVKHGGRIIDYHKTVRGNYAVHIETNDGVRHAFSSVSADSLRNVPGFTEE